MKMHAMVPPSLFNLQGWLIYIVFCLSVTQSQIRQGVGGGLPASYKTALQNPCNSCCALTIIIKITHYSFKVISSMPPPNLHP